MGQPQRQWAYDICEHESYYAVSISLFLMFSVVLCNQHCFFMSSYRYYREGNGAFVRNERKRVYGFGPKANLKRLEAKAGKKLVK